VSAAPPTNGSGERIARRRRRERSGVRRFRPGPGTSFYSPGMLGTAGTASRYAAASDENLDAEIDAVAHALEQQGPVGRAELARRLDARQWGPGRFRTALHVAVLEGRAEQLGRGSYGPMDEDRATRDRDPAAV
jgi:hypothetical protein